ncbi:MAG TPA: RNA polymerase sigma factor SigM [Micromonosporaceae bacterium]|nr:RNA polymerase sigma factor SigM [Micromonosporaceae bacterium]
MTDAASRRSDEELLSDHVAGDPHAFGELVRRHRDRLWAVALRTLGDREDAADAVQDALLSAYRSAGRFRGDSAVTTWLHRIVVNACLDRVRRRQARPTVPLGEVEVEPRVPGPDRETALDVRSALAELSADQRAALVLVDIEGYGVAEAAEMLGVAEGTVKSRCARGRARLAVRLGYLRTGEPGSEQPPGNRGPARRVPLGTAPEPGGRMPDKRASSGRDESAVSNATEAGT